MQEEKEARNSTATGLTESTAAAVGKAVLRKPLLNCTV